MFSPPRQIGRYEIRQELGRGLMGVVYEAHDSVLGREVALKTINVAFTHQPADPESFERRFLAEARIAARLSHPGIVIVHDVGRDDLSGLLFMALEKVPGETLAALLEKGARLPWRESLAIVRRVAEALQHAHENGIVHRDVKPANIMLLPSGQPKVLDFGIAKAENASLTAAGQFFGTPLYMSPEQALGNAVDPRSDIFALGSVAYALLTGRPAFEDESIMKILGRVAYHDARPPTQWVPDLPPDLDYVLARALAKNPSDRYPDARSLAEDVQDVLSGRPPRHLPSWRAPTAVMPGDIEATLLSRLGPHPNATITMEPPPAPVLPDSITTPFVPRASRTDQIGGPHPPEWMLAVALALTFALATVVFRDAPPPPRHRTAVTSAVTPVMSAVAAPAEPAASTPAAAPAAAPATQAPPAPPPAAEHTPVPKPAPARVVVDFAHPLALGRLRLWLDGDEMLVERLRGEVRKKLVLFRAKSGVLTEVLDVDPGRHKVKVEVSWEDQVRTEEISARFATGETYRLELRLKGSGRDLALRWTR